MTIRRRTDSMELMPHRMPIPFLMRLTIFLFHVWLAWFATTHLSSFFIAHFGDGLAWPAHVIAVLGGVVAIYAIVPGWLAPLVITYVTILGGLLLILLLGSIDWPYSPLPEILILFAYLFCLLLTMQWSMDRNEFHFWYKGP